MNCARARGASVHSWTTRLDGFFVLDINSIVLDVNRQACESLGYSREELIGQHRSLFDPDLDQVSV